jgi:isoleucyl-tRNA synthetase
MHGRPEYEGLTVFEANEPIIKLLAERGALVARESIHHSYPHCWRCHNPIIFRATEQWFIGMETPTANPDGAEISFRQRALDQIHHVRWDPKWGEERIANMVASRPDWCISRQRIWGVPIAVFLCRECHQPLNDPAVHRRVVDLFATEGADAWYVRSDNEILPANAKCPSCGAEGNPADVFEKEMDILDVWFESGASQAAVLGVDPELSWPADLYLEGGDQHRGWFQSSLLCAVGVRGAAPYGMAVTCGWTLDEQGRAMSKSLGNGVDPIDIADRMGAEIVRLWVASVDFREDMAASENLMQRVAENYRKLRNTFRYLLGNLNGFQPERDAIAWEQLRPLDKYMLVRTREVVEKVLRWYEEFEFHRVYHALNEFAAADLSAFYMDVIKDRLYTFAPQSLARRSAQTVLWTVAEALVRLVAPLVSFTADEVWQHLPVTANRGGSVHLELFPAPESIAPRVDPAWIGEWTQLLAIRDEALKSLEEARQSKRIGKALDAKMRLDAPPAQLALLEKYKDTLKEILNVSQVELGPSAGFQAITLPADGAKCERCWNYSIHIGEDPRWPTVCERCAPALSEMGFPPQQD